MRRFSWPCTPVGSPTPASRICRWRLVRVRPMAACTCMPASPPSNKPPVVSPPKPAHMHPRSAGRASCPGAPRLTRTRRGRLAPLGWFRSPHRPRRRPAALQGPAPRLQGRLPGRKPSAAPPPPPAAWQRPWPPAVSPPPPAPRPAGSTQHSGSGVGRAMWASVSIAACSIPGPALHPSAPSCTRHCAHTAASGAVGPTP